VKTHVYAPWVVALAIVAILAGCGGGSGVRFSDLFDESAAAEGTGIQGFGLVRAVVILATHEATSRQRRAAEQNGRRAVAQLKTQLAKKETPKAGQRKKPVASTTRPKAEATPGKASARTAKAKPTPAVVPEPEAEEEPASSPKAKLPRIIAVATEKDEKTDKKAAQAVMLFDTYSQEVVGNKVYDIESEPGKGEEVRFETYSAIYVGASL
jgi:hypothetical protein